MEYVISIFILGFMVTLLVLKGLMAAQELAKEELDQKLRGVKTE